MANLFAIHSVGESLRAYLESAYPAGLRASHPCTFTLTSSAEVTGGDASTDGASATLDLYLYLVSNETVRGLQLPSPNASQGNGAPALVVDLHYALSVRAQDAA